MRAISPLANYSIQLFEAVPKRGLDGSGTVVEYSDKKPVIAQFQRGGLTEWEQLTALENFDFSGLPEGVNPLSRVSMFDTEAYAFAVYADPREREDMLKKIDQRLEHLQTIFPSEFRIVPKPAADAPWPNYDELTSVEDILDLRQLTGVSAETVRLYEVENKNRSEVISAMEDLERELAGGTTEEKISVAVS